jgi:hypothetical protein
MEMNEIAINTKMLKIKTMEITGILVLLRGIFIDVWLL